MGFNKPPRYRFTPRSPSKLDLATDGIIFLTTPKRDWPMPRCSVTRRVHFNAAHRLHNPKFSAEWNRLTYGVCNNPNFHGHNYELDLTVDGEVDPDTGYVFDLNRLKTLAQEHLLRHLDHQNLNLDVSWFGDLIPSSENIAMVCWRELRAVLPAHLGLRLRLWETPRNYVDYEGA